MSRSATDRPCGSATARCGAAGTASRRRPATRGRSSRSTTPSTAPASTTRARGARPIAELRLADMDRDGVADAGHLRPDLPDLDRRPGAARRPATASTTTGCMEFCQAAPDRLIGVPMLPETPGRRARRAAAPGRQGRRAPGQADDRQHQPEARRPGLGAAVAGARGERHHPVLAHHRVRRQAGRPRRRQGGQRVREHQVLHGEFPRAVRRSVRLGHPRTPSEAARW